MFDEVISFIKNINPERNFIPLHEPVFSGNEKKYLNECIDSGYVSSVGAYVTAFEEAIAAYTGAKRAVVVVNGTQALHLACVVAGVGKEDEVITQPLTFIATANAISYTGAACIFVDVDKDTMGMSPESLKLFLETNAVIRDGKCFNKTTNKQIKACIPMHTFGHPLRIDEIATICKQYHITLIEDAAESIGSTYKGKATGRFGLMGTLSFNGNKIITSGGGGAIITDDDAVADLAKHLSTQAKIPHTWEYAHDHIGYNYRMPNLNAALALAQLENLDSFIEKKRALAIIYKTFFEKKGFNFVSEPEHAFSNYWLHAIILKDRTERDAFLNESNANGVMTRPIWNLMNKAPMFAQCQCTNLDNAQWLEDRVVNIPSSVTYKENESN
ncbi:LegC family aminotransferase [Cytophaga aurantiaca]|uniref:LegC family aminotransferase n=1 Tax=Cytophaga aurantiaca TaxID=29530 RepID=UPI0003733006|nr:LegC family aminotransferase [Cytophaga aurantiaca]